MALRISSLVSGFLALVGLCGLAAASASPAAGQALAPDSYEVFALPLLDPDHGPRTVEVSPADPTASPIGWHDAANIPRGNNAWASTDRNNDTVPDPGSQPTSPTRDFVGALVPLDLTMEPDTYLAASAVQIFYWANVVHDVLYLYGFDEAAGNFQSDNFGAGGVGGDAWEIDAQFSADQGTRNCATVSVLPDGVRGRLITCLWNLTTPERDGALSNDVTVHELGHGTSLRLTGGPATVSCLANAEQMGEGWSDWLALVFTAQVTDVASTPRPIGAYVLGQLPDGPGFRPAPYTTDPSLNSFGYANLPMLAVPHGVGFLWATMLWEVYWELVEEHGFNPDLYGDWTTGGNNLALQLVIDGLKLQACSPGFVDGRNAILLADQLLTGGDNQCALWRAFARRGLGLSAAQGSSNSTADGTASQDVPVVCALFSDGFESGDTSAWSSTVP